MSGQSELQGQEADAGEELFQAERDNQLWFLLFVLLAGSLWAQWLGTGAWIEIQSEDGSAAILALQLLPLAIAAVAVTWNHPAPRLVLFPISFLPGMALLTEAEWASMGEPLAMVLSAATFGLYLIVAASRPRTVNLMTLPRRTVESREAESADEFRWFVQQRVVVMALVGLAISYGLFFDPHIAAQIDAAGEQGPTQHAFMAVLLYFGWMIAVYMGAILPVLNWEHDRRQPVLPLRQRRLMEATQSLRRRVIFWVGLIVMVIFGSIAILVL